MNDQNFLSTRRKIINNFTMNQHIITNDVSNVAIDLLYKLIFAKFALSTYSVHRK